MVSEESGELVNSRQVADLANVKRPTVSMWSSRHPGFPQAREAGGTKWYIAADVARWLDQRPIPAGNLKPEEPAGTTYGQRFRRNWQRAVSSPEAPAAVHLWALQRVDDLFGAIGERIRGGGSQADYIRFVLGLVCVQTCASGQWSELPVNYRNPTGKWMLQWTAGQLDKAMRQLGIPPEMQALAERLHPESARDVTNLVSRCSELGREGFGRLMRRYQTAVGLDAHEAFTPPGVAELMAGLLVVDARNGPCTVYDPYLRGGELLAALAVKVRGVGRLSVRGESPRREMLRLAEMNLAVHGHQTTLAAGTFAPWAVRRARFQADFVLTNPPFNQKGPRTETLGDGGWPFGAPDKGTDNYAWLQYAYASLAEGGRAAVVMPNKATLSAPEISIRQKMIKQGAVECIITLPSGLFATTPVPVTIWILRRLPGRTGEVLFIDAGSMGVKDKAQRRLEHHEIARIVTAYRAWRNGGVDATGIAISSRTEWEIRNNNYSLNPSDYIRSAQTNESSADRKDGTHLAEAALSVYAADDTAEQAMMTLESQLSVGCSIGWQRVPLNTICDIQPGLGHGRFSSAELWDDGVPVVMANHLLDGRIQSTRIRRMPSDKAYGLTKYQLQAGDVLCVRVGSTGNSALAVEAQQGWIVGNNLLRLRPVPDRLDPRYLLAFLQLPEAIAWIQGRAEAGATAVASISRETLGQYMIDLPPLAEQRVISTALLALDEQIAAHHAHLDALENSRSSLSESLVKNNSRIDREKSFDEVQR